MTFLEIDAQTWFVQAGSPSRKQEWEKMFACIRIISSWFDVILLRESMIFSLNFDTWHAFHCFTRDFWKTNPCSIAPWAAYLRFRIVLRQQLVVIQWTLESHSGSELRNRHFRFFHMPYSYALGHFAGCLPRQDAFHGETSANTFTWAFSHWFVGTFRNEIHFQIDQTIWSSKKIAPFSTFSPKQIGMF